MWRGEGACQERARARGCSGASLLRAALEQGAAAGAQVATVMGHACPDLINVRDVLLAEPHRIRFAGRALLRGPLLRRCGRRRARERQAQGGGRERRGGLDRPELRLCDTNFHYRPSSWCSAPVSTVIQWAWQAAMLATVILQRIVKVIVDGGVVRSIG